MIRKLAFPFILNITITVLLFYTVPLFTYFLSKTYNPNNENINFSSWMGFMVVCFFLFIFFIAYFILAKNRMLKLFIFFLF
jgi:hypothetical protein